MILWIYQPKLCLQLLKLWIQYQFKQMWIRRKDVGIGVSLTVLSALLLKLLVDSFSITPTVANLLRWVAVTIVGFLLYRINRQHDGRVAKQFTRYSLRRLHKMTLSLLTFTALVYVGVYYLAAWIFCSVVFGVYEFAASKQSIYGEKPKQPEGN